MRTRNKELAFGSRIVHKIIVYFSAEEYVHLFVKRLIMSVSVRDLLVSVLTQCEHSHITLIYGYYYSFDQHHEENKNY